MRQMIELDPGACRPPALHRLDVPGALKAGLETAHGRPLVNSVTGEEERLDLVLPLIKKYDVPVVAISNDDTGISEDPDVRFEVARKIVHRAADFGIPAHDIVVDPLVMPIGAMATAGLQVFALVRRLREELGVNTTCGASNISFGLPNRHGINAAFLPMAIASGMTCGDHEPHPRGRDARHPRRQPPHQQRPLGRRPGSPPTRPPSPKARSRPAPAAAAKAAAAARDGRAALAARRRRGRDRRPPHSPRGRGPNRGHRPPRRPSLARRARRRPAGRRRCQRRAHRLPRPRLGWRAAR